MIVDSYSMATKCEAFEPVVRNKCYCSMFRAKTAHFRVNVLILLSDVVVTCINSRG